LNSTEEFLDIMGAICLLCRTPIRPRSHISKLRVLLLSILVGVLPMTAMGQPRVTGSHGAFSFYFENDVFAGTDRYYTNGTRLTWISPEVAAYPEHPCIPKWSLPFVTGLPFVNKSGHKRAIYVSAGQSIYTPEDIERTDLIKDDRPYAGVAYFAIGFQSKSPQHMESLEFDVGLVGPHSYAEQTQKAIHEWSDSMDPKGWDNQLEDEPFLEAIYLHKIKFIRSRLANGLEYDVIPHYGWGLGNAYTFANAGAQLRFGWNLPSDFGTFLIRPGCECNAPSGERDRSLPRGTNQLGIHVFAAIDGYAVLRDILLDGNTFRDSHSVEKEPFTADLLAGVGLTISRFKVSYGYVYRTKQFKTQRDQQVFGTITISFFY
jgi:hypothetical protein